MTLRTPVDLLFRARGSGRSFHFTLQSRGVLLPQYGRGAHEVIGDHPETYPSTDAVGPAVATTPETMSTFDHANAAFAPHAPALPAAEPSLSFMGAPRWRFAAWPGQDDASDAAHHGGLFIRRGGKAAIARRQVRGATKDRDVPIERGRPQRHVGGPRVMDLVGSNDLMLGFLNRDEFAEFGRLRDLPLPNRFGVRFEDAQDFVAHMRITAQQTGAGLI